MEPLDEHAMHKTRTALRILNVEQFLISALRQAAGPESQGLQVLERLAAEHLQRAESLRFPSADAAHSQMLADEYVEIVRGFVARLIDQS